MPATKKFSDTSLAAHKQAQPMIKKHHEKIIHALGKLNKPSSMQDIARVSKLDYHAVGRRLSELEAAGMVFKNGKGITKSGRSCHLYLATKHSSTSEFFEAFQDGRIGNEPLQCSDGAKLFIQPKLF